MTLILTDPTDALNRKVLRLELNPEKDLVLLDLPKRYSGHERGTTGFTEPVATRFLDQENCLELIRWLQETAEEMK